MPRRYLAPVMILAFLAAACGGAPAGQEFGAADAEALRTLARDFAAAYNAKDAQKTVSFFSGAGTLYPPNSSAVRGADSIRGYYEARFAEGGTDLQIDPKDMAGHGPLAYLSGAYTVRTQPPGGGPETRDRGKFLWIARSLGGQWRWEYQMWSSDLPAPAAP